MKIRVKEIAQVINGSTPSTKNPEYFDGDIIWITPKDLSEQNSKYVYSGERSITQAGYNSCSTKMIPANNILMSSRAPIGLIGINRVECCTNQGFKSLILDKTKCNVEYIYYYLKHHIKEIVSLGSGTTFKEVSKDSMEMYEIDLPNIEVQEKTSTILSLLDNKIINNNKINAELESMVKTLYNYWFLQFEFPNDDGKPYKSSGGKMVWNEELKREIPNGWEVTKIGEILKESTKSKVQVSEAKQDGEYPFFTSGESILRHNQFFVEDFNIFLNTGGNPDIKAYYGKSGYSTDTWCVSAGKYSYLLYYYLLKIKPQFEQLFFAGSGLKHLQKDVLKDIYIPLPKEKNLEYFNNFCLNIWKKITNQYKQNQELSSLRDFLLPLLMNGQVKFK
jgi:type I restriction enzyme S subunit